MENNIPLRKIPTGGGPSSDTIPTDTKYLLPPTPLKPIDEPIDPIIQEAIVRLKIEIAQKNNEHNSGEDNRIVVVGDTTDGRREE
jgi:hypothetical protein